MHIPVNGNTSTTQSSPNTPPSASPIHPHFPQHLAMMPAAHDLLSPTVQGVHHSPLMHHHLHEPQQQQYMQVGMSHPQVRVQAQEYQLTINGMHKFEPRSLLTPPVLE